MEFKHLDKINEIGPVFSKIEEYIKALSEKEKRELKAEFSECKQKTLLLEAFLESEKRKNG